MKSTNYSKVGYTNTQQDLPVGDSYITNSRHESLFGQWGSFAKKQQRVCPYFQDFSTSSSFFLLKTTVGQSPRATNILIKGKNQQTYKGSQKRQRGKRAPNQQFG
jgi:hypothetical protein